MQRAARAPGCKSPVEDISVSNRPGVHDDDGIDGWTVPIIGGDPSQVLLDQRATGDLARPHCRVNIGNAGFYHVEWRARSGRLGAQRGGHQRGNDEGDDGTPQVPALVTICVGIFGRRRIYPNAHQERDYRRDRPYAITHARSYVPQAQDDH